jgi:tetratricopeptide (TPR) repeat protein
VALEWAHRARSPLELGLAVLYQRSARVFPGEGREVLGRALTNDDGRRPRLRARALAAAGGLARAQVDLEAAQACLDESLRLYREAGDWEGETWILTWLAGLATDRGDLEEAVRLAQERVAIARLMGDTRRLGYALNWLAYFSLAQGEYAEARTQLAEGASLAEGYVTPFSAVLRAYVELLDGDRIQAVGIVAAVLTDLRPDEEQWFGWVLVDDLAAMLAGADEMNTAVQLYAAAASWFRSRGTRTDDMPRQLREKTHGPLERASDAPAFESAAEGGSRMSYDDAVANGLAAAQRVAARS